MHLSHCHVCGSSQCSTHWNMRVPGVIVSPMYHSKYKATAHCTVYTKKFTKSIIIGISMLKLFNFSTAIKYFVYCLPIIPKHHLLPVFLFEELLLNLICSHFRLSSADLVTVSAQKSNFFHRSSLSSFIGLATKFAQIWHG